MFEGGGRTVEGLSRALSKRDPARVRPATARLRMIPAPLSHQTYRNCCKCCPTPFRSAAPSVATRVFSPPRSINMAC